MNLISQTKSEIFSPSDMEEKTIRTIGLLQKTAIPVNTIPSSQVLPSRVNYTVVEIDDQVSHTDLSSSILIDPQDIMGQPNDQSPDSAMNVSFTELINSYCSYGKENEAEVLKCLLNDWKIPLQFHQYFIGKYIISFLSHNI